jgi:O-antigen ligase
VIRGLDHARLLGIGAFVAPALSVLAPKALVPLILLLGFGVFALAAVRGQRPSVTPSALLVACTALLTWGISSALWSIDPLASLGLSISLVVLFAAGALLSGTVPTLSAAGHETVERGFLLGVAIGLALLAIEVSANAPLSRLLKVGPSAFGGEAGESYLVLVNRGAAVLAIWAWPCALVLWRRRGWFHAAVPIAAALAITLASESAASAIAVIVGIAALLLVRMGPGPALRTAAVLLVLGIAAAPALPFVAPSPLAIIEAVPALPNSAYHRLQIWEFTARRILERPVLGWGLDASRAMPGGERRVRTDVTIAGRTQRLSDNSPLLPLHPHNGMLQLWLELGAIGALIGAGLGVVLLRALWRRSSSPAAIAFAAAGLAAGLTVFGLSFGIWQNWWLAALWLGGVFTQAGLRPDERS